MKTMKIRKLCLFIGVILLSAVFFTANAFPWGSATHAYIDNNLGKKRDLYNLNEIYGGMAADMFNFYAGSLDPNSPYYYLYLQAHFNSLALWDKAQEIKFAPLGVASAFGFVSHDNLALGADYTAHGPDNVSGYVQPKAEKLYEDPVLLAAFQLLEIEPEVALSICHNIVEFGIDIRVVYDMGKDFKIGQKMLASAIFRTPMFPLLLMKAYAKDLSEVSGMSRFEAAQFINSAENEFRRTIIIYAQTLMQTEELDAVDSVATLLASLAQEVYGITPPGGSEDFIDLIKYALLQAMSVCDDYQTAVQDTIEYVETQMSGAGISY